MKGEPLTTPSQKYLRERLYYDSSSGKLLWKPRPRTDFDTIRGWKVWNTRFPGTLAGATGEGNRYLRTAISGVRYLCHRLIWKMVYGADPEGRVTHVNGDATDNRLQNLRLKE